MTAIQATVVPLTSSTSAPYRRVLAGMGFGYSIAPSELPGGAYRPMGTPENPGAEVTVPGGASRKSDDERKQLLARQIQTAAATGGRVESQSDFQAIVVRGKPVNHVLHLIVTLVTIGIWGIVWIALALTGGEKREMVLVDEWGNPSIQKL